ncbi:hypothetical protein HMPREF9440_00252 [Sutterella parvirubra YIT 11816]|uniref:Uncharacterized protein n=1 Tax=Sutterella parvirubra YIT 11816 TaxID=762967 RepID=H3KC02_9BURK|nr:hypothetical protein HMPREF9440_00252 [Sutterella parvirubra YIT 11816]
MQVLRRFPIRHEPAAAGNRNPPAARFQVSRIMTQKNFRSGCTAAYAAGKFMR